MPVLGTGSDVLRCFVETSDAGSLLEEASSGPDPEPPATTSCPADARLLKCVNASEAYGDNAQRIRVKAAKAIVSGDAAVGTSMAALIGSAVQAAVLTFLIGPSILLLGTAVPKAVIVVQSIIQFGYITLINMMLGANILVIGSIVQASYELILGAVTLIIAALLREEINRLNKALLTGRLLIYPIIEYAAVMLFERLAECKLFGAVSDEFPFGEPGLCRDKCARVRRSF